MNIHSLMNFIIIPHWVLDGIRISRLNGSMAKQVHFYIHVVSIPHNTCTLFIWMCGYILSRATSQRAPKFGGVRTCGGLLVSGPPTMQMKLPCLHHLPKIGCTSKQSLILMPYSHDTSLLTLRVGRDNIL